jgi:Fe-Mn family superoxide dismutase
MFTLPSLPWAPNALAPMISEETINFHYGKHHQTYVNNLNQLLEGSGKERLSLEELITTTRGGLFNNAAQVWNHSFYWESLTPDAPPQPSGKLLQMIIDQYGSFEDFKKTFSQLAVSLFGSGWAWLVLALEGTLDIVQTSNADNPLTRGQKPLLACDVWEHAYYVDYRNKRAEYVDNFFKIINWNKANERLS